MYEPFFPLHRWFVSLFRFRVLIFIRERGNLENNLAGYLHVGTWCRIDNAVRGLHRVINWGLEGKCLNIKGINGTYGPHIKT